MMKHIKTILLIGLFTHITLHPLAKADWKKVNAIILTSTGVGAIGTAVASTYMGKKLAEKNIGPRFTPRKKMISLIGVAAAGGTAAGIATLGALQIGSNLAINYIARKYGINKRIALVAMLYDLVDFDRKKEVLVAADQKNTIAIRSYLANLFEKNYGKHWKQQVAELINQYAKSLGMYQDTAAANKAFMNNIETDKALKFIVFVNANLLPLGILYLNKPIKYISWMHTSANDLFLTARTPKRYSPQEISQIINQFVTQIGLFD